MMASESSVGPGSSGSNSDNGWDLSRSGEGGES